MVEKRGIAAGDDIAERAKYWDLDDIRATLVD